jgi:hypothetical protein
VTPRTRQLIIEVGSVLVILLCVVAIAIPKSRELQRQATARQLLDDIDVVRGAVYQFYSDSAYFPAEMQDGSVPPGLARYLPADFSMRRPYATLQYKNWPLGTSRTSVTPNIVGAIVTTPDPRIGETAASLVPAQPEFTVGDRFAFLFFGG